MMFPILQKTTVNVHMSAPRLLLKRKLPGNRQAVCVIRLLAENGNIKSAVLLVTSRQLWGLNTRPPESGDNEEDLECLSTVEVPLSKVPKPVDSSVTSPSVVACALCVIPCNFPSGRLILLLSLSQTEALSIRCSWKENNHLKKRCYLRINIFSSQMLFSPKTQRILLFNQL